MAISLTGENSYLIGSELRRLKADFIGHNDPLGLEVIDDSELAVEDLEQRLHSYSFLSPRRLVILVTPSLIKQFVDNIEQILESLAETTEVVIIEPSLDKRSVYYKFLSSKTDFRSFGKLPPDKLIDFLVNYAKSCGAVISRNQAMHLVDRVGDDQLLLSHEIDKLSLYGDQITPETIDLLTEQSASSTIFQLLDAAFSSRQQKALRLYNDQRAQKVEPEQILSMIGWQLHILAQAMAAANLPFEQALAATKMSSFTLKKAKQISLKLTLNDLKTMVRELSTIDYRSKSQSFDLDEAIKNFIVAI